MSIDDVLNVAEASSRLKVHPETVRQMARAGSIPARKVGKEWRFSWAALLRWLDNSAEQKQQERPKTSFGNPNVPIHIPELMRRNDTFDILASQRPKGTRRKRKLSRLEMRELAAKQGGD